MAQKGILSVSSLSAALAGYWSLIFVGTHIPKPPVIHVQHADKLVHFAAFAILASLFTAVFSRQRLGIRDIAIGLFCLIYAGVDELTQIPVGRTADVYDWLADCLGIVCGIVFCRFILGRTFTRSEWRLVRQPRPQEAQRA
jgi:VanZ family protein